MASLLINLQNFWKLSESSGNRADSVGADTLTDTGTVLSDVGLVYTTAAEFDGSNELKVSSATLQGGDTTFTLAAWFWPDALPAATVGLLGKWSTGVREYVTTLDASGNVIWIVSPDGSSQVPVQCATQAVAGVWNLVIVEHNATADEIRAWLNNDAGASVSHAGGVSAGAAVFSLGRGDQDGNYLENRTRMGPVAFWRGALTAEERARVWNGNTGLPLDAFGGRNPFTTAVDPRPLAAVIWRAAGAM